MFMEVLGLKKKKPETPLVCMLSLYHEGGTSQTLAFSVRSGMEARGLAVAAVSGIELPDIVLPKAAYATVSFQETGKRREEHAFPERFPHKLGIVDQALHGY